MCLIVFTPNIAETPIKKDVLERGFNANSHGAGFAYIEDNKVKISKAYHEFDAFYKALERNVYKRVKKGPVLIHFRWATCGSHNYTNTQPVNIQKNKLVMAHNGVFPGLSFNDDADESDSVYLSKIIADLKWKLPFTNAQHMLLAGLCDSYSKLVFLDNKGKYEIVCPELGKWVKGVWYSDSGECLRSPRIPRGQRHPEIFYDDGDFKPGRADRTEDPHEYIPSARELAIMEAAEKVRNRRPTQVQQTRLPARATHFTPPALSGRVEQHPEYGFFSRSSMM